MIIEFLGPTGSGKSTLINNIIQTCESHRTYSGEGFILNKFGFSSNISGITRILVLHFLTIPSFLIHLIVNFKLHILVLYLLLHNNESLLTSLNSFRNFVKSTGIYYLCKFLKSKNTYILIDEGPLHMAHTFFISQKGLNTKLESLNTYINKTFIPSHLYISLNTPSEILKNRIIERTHKRIKDTSSQSYSKFILGTISIFDQIDAHLRKTPNYFIISSQNKSLFKLTNEIVSTIYPD